RSPFTVTAEQAVKGACGDLNRRSAAKPGVRRSRFAAMAARVLAQGSTTCAASPPRASAERQQYFASFTVLIIEAAETHLKRQLPE
ncbi:MAG TPA: hypothetical protein VL992_09030, partial [Tepidisphaeraceae bacterium]|nr:hypothetical protein [Tepidisphaeraceae bacterium]